MDRAIFFVEKLRLHSVRVTLHRERAIFQMRKKHRRDADVVIDYLAFGEAGLRIQDLVQIRNRELFSFNDEFGFIGHGALKIRVRDVTRLVIPSKARNLASF